MDSKTSTQPYWQTGTGNAVWTWFDSRADTTTIYVPTVDVNGKHYVREIVVRGDSVLDMGRDQA